MLNCTLLHPTAWAECETVKQFLQTKQAWSHACQNMACIRTCEILIEQLQCLFSFYFIQTASNKSFNTKLKIPLLTRHTSVSVNCLSTSMCACVRVSILNFLLRMAVIPAVRCVQRRVHQKHTRLHIVICHQSIHHWMRSSDNGSSDPGE